MEYKIKPSSRKLTYVENDLIPEHMPKVPSRILITAPSGSGKTQLMGSLLRDEIYGYKDVFKGNIFVMSSTFSLKDPAWDDVNIKEENVWDDYREDIIEELIEDQENIIKDRGGKDKGVPHILLILDDLITQIPQSRQSSLVKLFVSGRHRLISIWMTTQSYKHCPKAIRLNTTAQIVFKVNNIERQAMAEENQVDSNLFLNLYEIATEEPYSFLYINNEKPIKERYYKNFEELLSITNI